MKDYAKKLIEVRPSMAPIASKLSSLYSKLDFNQSLETFRNQVKKETSRIINETEEIKQRISEHARVIMVKPQTVFTHSSSSTVMKVITELHTSNVICTESRPQLEGRKMAKELKDHGLKVILVIDAAMGVFMQSVDLALTGADCVQQDGSVINKVGTRMLAYAAQDQGIPFYIVCDTYKFNILNYLGRKIQLEEHPPDEVGDIEGIKVRNPYFEIVPNELITGIITEQGLMDTLDIKRKLAEMSKNVKPFIV